MGASPNRNAAGVQVLDMGSSSGTSIQGNITNEGISTNSGAVINESTVNSQGAVTDDAALNVAGILTAEAALVAETTLAVTGQSDLKAAVLFSGIETIAGGGTTTALSLTKSLHSIDADAGGDIFTLADGTIGQLMTITCLSATGVATITPANLNGGTSVTMNAAGESVILQFVDTNWYILGGNAYTVI